MSGVQSGTISNFQVGISADVGTFNAVANSHFDTLMEEIEKVNIHVLTRLRGSTMEIDYDILAHTSVIRLKLE